MKQINQPSEKILSSLLFAIREGLDISISLELGLSFAQLAEIIIYSQKEGFCERADNRYYLTPKGLELLSRVPPLLKREKRSVEPSFKDKVLKVSLETIYIPRKSPL